MNANLSQVDLASPVPAQRLDHAALMPLFRRVPILASLTDSDLLCLQGIEQVWRQTGELIERQGDVGRSFWILLDGRLRVSVERLDSTHYPSAILETGSTFGELPLLGNIQNPSTIEALERSLLLRFTEEEFWHLMTTCPEVRKAILGNMAVRLQKIQTSVVQQEKMAALGTLAAGLMHELNNPGAAARRAATQLRENLMRLHDLSARFTRTTLSESQKDCLVDLQMRALNAAPLHMNSLEQSDAEESLAEWMESAQIENAWKLAPTLVSVGFGAGELGCVRGSFEGPIFSDALNWLDALVSSMQLVGTIEESIGRVSTLVKAVKSYAYEGKGQQQQVNVNESLHTTLVILGHKMREKQITVEKSLDPGLPVLESFCSGLNQIWTNILDNAVDAVPERGHIRIKTWTENDPASEVPFLCITIEDDGPGIPLDSQAHIFDPFYTTKPAGIGTGLGLGIAHKIVQQYGGTIRFSSEPGNTIFRVRLPARQTAPPAISYPAS